MKHIVLLTGNPLCNNPRAHKEAEALAGAGYKVTIFGAWMSAEHKQRDLELLRDAPFVFEAVLNVSDEGAVGSAQLQLARLKTAGGRKVHAITGAESRWQLGYTVDRLNERAKSSEADLFIAHSEPALFAARELHRRGRRIGVDMEDWYSEDLPAEAHRTHPAPRLR
jgi:hypothetical protein